MQEEQERGEEPDEVRRGQSREPKTATKSTQNIGALGKVLIRHVEPS